MSEGCCDTITLFKGEDGRTIWNGPGTPTLFGPTLTDVQEGDFYIDTNTWEIYGPYSVSGWGTGTSLIGPEGDPGDPGDPGNGIVSTLWTSNSAGNPGPGAAGTVDTYTITYDDATTDTFTVTNGNATVYDLDSVQNGPDADIRLVPGLGTTDIVKLEAGTNITLTDTGSNIKIDAAGGASGGLTWITETFQSAGSLSVLTNHGYILRSVLGDLSASTITLPLGAAVGDIIKIIGAGASAAVTCDASQIITLGMNFNVSQGLPAQPATVFTTPLKFYFGPSESMQLLYMGASASLPSQGQWVIDSFTTNADTADSPAAGYPLVTRIQP